MMKRSPPCKKDMTHSVSDTDIPKFFRKEAEKQSQRISAKRTRVTDVDDEAQDSWSTFMSEMKNMIESMADKQNVRLEKLEKCMQEIKKQNDTIQNSNSDLKKSMDFISDQIQVIQVKVTKLEGDKETIKKQIVTIEDKIENMERINRKTSIEIRNVPKMPIEGKNDLFRMIEKLHCTIDSSDKADAYQLRDVYRLPSKPNGKTSTVVAEFRDTLAKDSFLRKTKKYIKNKYEQLSSQHLGLNDEKTFIYISEHLTMKATRLFYLARDVAKTQGFAFCWTSNGRVYLRKKENAPLIMVRDEESLASLRGDTIESTK